MSSDHDIMRLPDSPPPAPDARAAALQQAMLRFDQKSAEEKNAEDSQGIPTDLRLIERTAASLRPSRERSVMKRTRYLLAASLACVVAGSGVYLHLMRSPPLQEHAALSVEPKVAGNEIAQAPSPVPARKESDGEASLRTHIPADTEAAKPNQQAAAPSAAAPPPPAKPLVQGPVSYTHLTLPTNREV